MYLDVSDRIAAYIKLFVLSSETLYSKVFTLSSRIKVQTVPITLVVKQEIATVFAYKLFELRVDCYFLLLIF